MAEAGDEKGEKQQYWVLPRGPSFGGENVFPLASSLHLWDPSSIARLSGAGRRRCKVGVLWVFLSLFLGIKACLFPDEHELLGSAHKTTVRLIIRNFLRFLQGRSSPFRTQKFAAWYIFFSSPCTVKEGFLVMYPKVCHTQREYDIEVRLQREQLWYKGATCFCVLGL